MSVIGVGLGEFVRDTHRASQRLPTYRHFIGIRAGGQLASDDNPINCSGYEEGTWTPGDSPGISSPADSPGDPAAPRHTTRTIVQVKARRWDSPAASTSATWHKLFYLFVLTYNIEWDILGLV